MRISDRYDRFTDDRVNTTKSNATKSADTSASTSANTATSTAQSGALSVSVSDQARGLAAAGSARIEQLRDQVRSGTFKVDAQDIANKLVGEDA